MPNYPRPGAAIRVPKALDPPKPHFCIQACNKNTQTGPSMSIVHVLPGLFNQVNTEQVRLSCTFTN